jgi:hypothetical protein
MNTTKTFVESRRTLCTDEMPHECSVCRARHTCHTGTSIAQTRYWCGFARPEALTTESATSGRSPGDSRVKSGSRA